ncbi:hypothetical protein HY990_07200 [Candidatus Micrarchaeota archaeon]|nr:hypothetical protein [Candidatus Micrarchaeota archaeon]
MAEDFAGMTIAITVVTASIILAGILIGLGRSFGYKKIELFGIEELAQSVINAAIIGAFAALVAMISGLGSTITINACSTGSLLSQLSCSLSSASLGIGTFSSSLFQMLLTLGYYQDLILNFSAFSIAPFGNLDSISHILRSQMDMSNFISLLFAINVAISDFISNNALSLLFPSGLILRTFFASRRLGGMLIAIAVGAVLFYPTFILIFPNPAPELNNATMAMNAFNNNSYFAPVPIVDLNNNYAIAAKIDIMSGRCANNGTMIVNSSRCLDSNLTGFSRTNSSLVSTFSSDLTVISQKNNAAMGKALLFGLVAPIFSLIITLFFVIELGKVLGGDIGIKSFDLL